MMPNCQSISKHVFSGTRLIRGMSFVIAMLASAIASGQEIVNELTVETVLEGLNHPSGVAIQPGSQTVFVSDSGSGQVVKLVDGKAEPVITNFPVQPLVADFGFEAGPLGIAFMSDNSLAVGTGGWDASSDRISVFDVSKSVSDAEQSTASRSIDATGGSPAEGDFFGLAVFEETLFVTGRGDEKFGWINRLNSNEKDKVVFKRFIDSWVGTETKLPTAITINPDGFITVGLRGENGAASTLAFFDLSDGKLKAKFGLTQNGIVALAYGPNAKKLYALFNSANDTEKNGLYKLIGRKRNTECELQLVQEIEFPLAMAFADNGDLFVACGRENGKLLKFGGLDANPPTSEKPGEASQASDSVESIVD